MITLTLVFAPLWTRPPLARLTLSARALTDPPAIRCGALTDPPLALGGSGRPSSLTPPPEAYPCAIRLTRFFITLSALCSFIGCAISVVLPLGQRRISRL